MSTKKDILLLAKSLSDARGVTEDVVFRAIESALAAITAKTFYQEEADIRVAIDEKTGDYETFRRWTVVADEDHEIPAMQLTIEQAEALDPELQLGDVVEEMIDNVDFGRIGAQQAKQVIMQKVREAEREKIAKQYRRRVGDLVMGVVKRVTRDYIILDMGESAEAIMLREDMIPREAFRMNDRLRAYLYDVRDERRGPQLMVSRTCPEFLVELFKIEVPEIGEGVIEVRAAARDAGSRAKIAVKTNDGRIDPIGACVGMRGSRVQAVSNELGGERIDIILFDDNPAQFVINAMAPAEVASIVVDEDTHAMDIAVADDQLSQAIGRGGQNVRLASELSGWTLNVMNEGDAVKKHENEAMAVKSLFMDKLEVDEDIAEILMQQGFTSIEEIAYVALAELSNIDEFDEDTAEEIQRRASDVLLTEEISGKSATDLASLEGMQPEWVAQLAIQEIITRDDLAEQSIDELMELIEIDQEAAAKLIMKAREHWFTS